MNDLRALMMAGMRPDERNMRKTLPQRPDERGMRLVGPGQVDPRLRPDDTGLVWQGPQTPDPRKVQDTQGLLAGMGFPGQMGLLAQQLNQGFGGGLQANRQYLADIYDPVQMPEMVEYGIAEAKEDEADAKKRGKNEVGEVRRTWHLNRNIPIRY